MFDNLNDNKRNSCLPFFSSTAWCVDNFYVTTFLHEILQTKHHTQERTHKIDHEIYLYTKQYQQKNKAILFTQIQAKMQQ